MLNEQKIERDKEQARFKTDMFNHAWASQNRELYSKVWPEDFGMTPEEEQNLEFIIPESEEEALAMFAELDEIDDPHSNWRSTPLIV